MIPSSISDLTSKIVLKSVEWLVSDHYPKKSHGEEGKGGGGGDIGKIPQKAPEPHLLVWLEFIFIPKGYHCQIVPVNFLAEHSKRCCNNSMTRRFSF